ncbi:MAG: hypothetical protein AB8B74_15260 [Crocinitomicaceae bacterium]
MKKFNLLFLFGLVLTLSITSCKKDKIEEPIPPVENPGPNVSASPAVLNLGNSVNASFFARIVDENGNAVQSATVKVGNKSAFTNDDGIVVISGATVKEKLAYLTVTKSGYFLGSRSLIPETNATNEVKITLLKMDVIATISSGTPTTVSTPSGLSIDFKGDYVTASGAVYSGNVSVAVKHIETTSNDMSNQMPGALYAQDASNNSGVLESYGMAAIEIFTPAGAELQIAKGSSAKLHMPIDNSQLNNAPSTIPLWHFDEIAGYWIEEGEATLINGEYVGEVKHFSFWNCDDFYDDATIDGSIIDGSGNPVSHGSVQIVTPNATTVGQVSGSGHFFSYVPANVSVTFNVFDDCGNQISTWTNTFATNSNITHVFTAPSGNPNTITGTMLDCANAPVSNGYVELLIGNNTVYASTTNGIFTVNLGNCNTSTSFTIEGYDFQAIQSTGLLTFSTTGQTTNIGNIIACTAVPEYITYTIDNDPAITLFAPIYCQEYADTLNPTINHVTINGTGTNSYFYLDIEGNTVGAYNFINYGSSTPGASLILNPVLNSSGGYPNIIFNLNAHGAVGTYTDVTFSGTFLDYSNVSHTLSGSLHVVRDL